MHKTRIAVDTTKEGDQIRAGLNDPMMRAVVKVIGVLNTLPSDRARGRVLMFLWDSLDEDRANAARDVERTRR